MPGQNLPHSAAGLHHTSGGPLQAGSSVPQQLYGNGSTDASATNGASTSQPQLLPRNAYGPTNSPHLLVSQHNNFLTNSDAGYHLLSLPRLSLFVGLTDSPWVLKVSPPKKGWKGDDNTFPRFHAIAVDSRRCLLSDSSSHQVFVINHERQTKDRIAGCGKCGFLDGPLDVCRLNQPLGLALDSARGFIYVADGANHRIRCINLSTGFMSTVVGNGCRGCGANTLDTPYEVQFYAPHFLLITCVDNSVRTYDLKTRTLNTILIGS